MKTVVLVAIAALLLAACSREEPSRGTAITNVTVIDAVNGVRQNQTVLFYGDKILAVTSSDSLFPPPEKIIDGSGKFLIPGLWDMHVHLTYDDAFTESMPALFLAYGITSVRDTGGLIDKLRPVVEKMRAPGAIAPRVFYSGPLLDGKYVVYDGKSRPEIGTQNASEEMAEQQVAALQEAGVDFIKIYEMVSPDVFAALVSAGQSRGLPIAAHVPLSMLASQAGPAVDSMEHLRNVELDCASNAAELYEERLSRLNNEDGVSGYELRSGMHSAQRVPAIRNYDEERCDRTIASLRSTIQVPTLRLVAYPLRSSYDHPDWDEALTQVPEARQEDWRTATNEWLESTDRGDTTFARWSLSLVGRMHAQGVPIGAGTDTPIARALPGFSLHTELERLVEAGLTPLEALESATVRPAEFFSLQQEMGAIEVGMRADLVLLNANPLDNISNTREIAAVVTKGRLLMPENSY
ncbi:MAG: amidohydrolase family protein [Gammaproteobacteria bacterium]|nr:amidohydrolase family protein [Gammaproteobacteria bacterium]